MKKYYFEIQFMNRTETHWTKSNNVDNARDVMWDRYRNAITITFIKQIKNHILIDSIKFMLSYRHNGEKEGTI